MAAVIVRRKLESETLHLPEIKPLLGKNVEIIIREESGSHDPGCFHDLSPINPLDENTKDVLRGLLTPDQFNALVEVVAEGVPDVDAIRRLRAASMT